MTGKDTSVRYDPSVLKVGTPRNRVLAAFGQPNGVREVNGVYEDVYAFFPDGYKYMDPHVTAGTMAAAVFTGGISLATRQARIIIQRNRLTLYHGLYDAKQNIRQVKLTPPNIGSQPTGSEPQSAVPPPGPSR